MYFSLRTYSLGVALPLLFSSPTIVSAAGDATSLDTVVVTANRVARTVDDSLASVTVLTDKDIEKEQASSLIELLQARAGFQFANNGGKGKLTSLFLRGTESDHTLLLIDGIKINQASSGATSLELVPLEIIERIEIVRGPRTSLYGSDAIGGIIQIFTKKGKIGEKAKPTVALTVGSDDTRGLSAGIRGGFDKGWYGLQVKKEDTDGYNACTGDSTTLAGCGAEEFDDDGYDNTSASFNVGYQLSEKTTVSAQFLRTDNDIEFDGGFENESESIIESYGVTLSSDLNDNATLIFSAGHADNKSTSFKDGVFASRFDTKRDTYSLQSNIDITNNQLLTVGLDYQDDKVNSSFYTANDRDNKGVFAEYQIDTARQNITISARNDDNEQFGSKTTGNIAVGHAINNNLKLIGSYGSAFKTPTFNDLYFSFPFTPDILNTVDPEQSKSIEIGLRGQQTWGNWSAHIYQTKINDLITFPNGIASNINKAEIKGLEFIANTRIQNWDLGTNITFLDTEDKSGGPNDGNDLIRRPDQSARFNLDRDFGKFSLGGSLIAESDRFDDAGNNRKISGYATTDLRASYRFNKALSLQAKIGNVFDKSYETASFFPQDGTNYMLTLRYAPE